MSLWAPSQPSHQDRLASLDLAALWCKQDPLKCSRILPLTLAATFPWRYCLSGCKRSSGSGCARNRGWITYLWGRFWEAVKTWIQLKWLKSYSLQDHNQAGNGCNRLLTPSGARWTSLQSKGRRHWSSFPWKLAWIRKVQILSLSPEEGTMGCSCSCPQPS